MVKHIVMFRIAEKDESKKKEIASQLKTALDALPAKISEIKYFEVGLNFAAVGNAFDAVLISEFDNNDTLNQYRVHPEHQKVVAFIKGICDQTAVVDYLI